IAVVNMAGTTGLLWVVTYLRSLLVPVERLDRNVDVQDPRQPEGGGNAAQDLVADPVETGLFGHASDAQAHGILADSAFHPKQTGVDPVATHSIDMGIAPMPAQYAQERRAHDIACP